MLLALLDQVSQIYYQSSNPSQTDTYKAYIIIGIAAAAIISFFFRRFTLAHRGSALENAISRSEPNITVESDTSILMTIYTLGVSLSKISSGTIQNYNYSIFVTTPIGMETQDGENSSDNDSVDASIDDSLDFDKYDNLSDGGMGRVHYNPPETTIAPIAVGQFRTPANQILIKLDLPIKSQVHIAGFSLQDEVFKRLLGNTNIDYIMTKVALEGDFPDYFKLYCQSGKEVELREVLDPSTMESLVDFCNQFNWELFENNLYFVQSDTTKASNSNNTGVLKGAEDFVAKILPTLTRMQTTTPESDSQAKQTPNSTPPTT